MRAVPERLRPAISESARPVPEGGPPIAGTTGAILTRGPPFEGPLLARRPSFSRRPAVVWRPGVARWFAVAWRRPAVVRWPAVVWRPDVARRSAFTRRRSIHAIAAHVGRETTTLLVARHFEPIPWIAVLAARAPLRAAPDLCRLPLRRRRGAFVVL
ncbi:MAG TPA: hypothetical protein VHI99_06120 [Vicinamibacterales bacterium]|nr:hypothetical protein [Vicinamibacterales bacterium]